jgi:hypothetical protein
LTYASAVKNFSANDESNLHIAANHSIKKHFHHNARWIYNYKRLFLSVTSSNMVNAGQLSLITVN